MQQGISNIVELFKCLDDRVPPPGATLASPLSSANPPVSVAHALGDIVRFCVQVARANPGDASVVFTDAQVVSLREFVSSGLTSPSKLQPVEASLGMRRTGKTGTGRDVSPTQSVVSRAKRRTSIKNAHSTKVTESNPLLITPWIANFSATTTDSERTHEAAEAEEEEDAEDDDAMVSSESDTEDTRRDMKRSEKDTLHQVEALLQTFETRQILLKQEAHAPDAASSTKLRRQRSGGRHGSVSAADGGTASDASLMLIQQHAASESGDKAARLEAVHAFFREKRRRERQEQQQQREMLALLVEASYNTPQHSTSDHTSGSSTAHHHSADGTTPSRGVNRSKLASAMPRKRSNGVATLALHSVVHEQQQQQQQTGARRPQRPKTVR